MTPYRHFADFSLNIPQARTLMVMPNELWVFAGRGSGKTTGVSAPWVLHKVEVMPGSCGGLIGQSFADLESKILKPLFAAFGMMGHKEDVHFTYGKVPPKSWKRPLTPIIDWKYVIAFPNGTVIQLISLHQAGSANSNSFQWIFGPEAKYFKQAQLQSEVFPTLRGNVDQFGASAWYGAKLFETDKYSGNIHWLLQKRDLHDEEVISAVLHYQLKVNQLRQQLATVEERQAYRVIKKIKAINTVLTAMRKNLVMVSEFSAFDNIRNLSPDYIRNMRRSLTPYEFSVMIENKDPTKVEDGFYPDRTENNLYMSADDSDVDTMQPLAVALDWQASLTPLVACQINEKLIPGIKTLNFLQAFYVKHPFGIPDVIKDFCNYNKAHLNKRVIFYYDHTAVAERNAAKSYYIEAKNAFIKHGWEVDLQYLGQAPLHELKYNKVNHHLRGEGKYPIRMHMKRCETLILAMDGTEVKAGSTYKKDKSKETDKTYPQQYATHFPDVFDTLIWGICELDRYPTGGRSSDYVHVGIGMPSH